MIVALHRCNKQSGSSLNDMEIIYCIYYLIRFDFLRTARFGIDMGACNELIIKLIHHMYIITYYFHYL